MIEYTVIYEKGENNWGAYIPDLAGCISIGDSFLEVQENIKEAIALYLEVLQEDGQPIPQPSIQVWKVAIMV